MGRGRCGGWGSLTRSAVATIGEALIAITPDGPHGLVATSLLRLWVGGAEVNVAVGLARLGIPSIWVGRIGDDPLGRRVLAQLASEGVAVRATPTDRRTGIYLREWLPDGARRPYYYRAGAAGSALTADDWPEDVAGIGWVHVTGITPALGSGPAAAVRRAMESAAKSGIPVSFDPNYRPALWPRVEAATALRQLVPLADVVLAGHDEIELLFETDEPWQAARRALDMGAGCCVVKLGDRGAIGLDQSGGAEVGAVAADAVDPVGAGDAFDAGFIAARLAGADLRDSLRLGAHCGARAVEQPTEHDGALRLAELPSDLRALID
ncbi:MAG: sugar kinase [Candidatus Dormibacteria bacterium]